MKTVQLIAVALLLTIVSNPIFAQSKKTATFTVYGNCGMCQSKIEKAAKTAGASFASWSEDSKILTVKYKAGSTDLSKIQQKIADAGYDNEGAKAPDAAYDKLQDCCKYDRPVQKDTLNKK